MVNSSAVTNPEGLSPSLAVANDESTASGITPTEVSASAKIPSEAPAEGRLEANSQEETIKDATVSPIAAETKPHPDGPTELAATTNEADSKPEESPLTAKQSKSEKATKVGGTKGKEEKTAEQKVENTDASVGPVVSASKRTRPPYKYDPEKVTLRFLFANKDGLTVTVECKPGDTVGEVKGQLLSVWPEDLPDCSGGENVRLICMGKGILMPDSRTLEDCQVPVFKTHPTPINVSVRPTTSSVEPTKSTKEKSNGVGGVPPPGGSSGRPVEQTSQGCGCLIQ